MKPALISFMVLFFPILLSGQVYNPLVGENKEWNVLQVIEGWPMWDTTYWTITYKFDGDTLIEGLMYKKVFKTEEEIPINWSYEGGIREDQDKRVYFKSWHPDELKYDFGAEIGDTVEIVDNTYPVQLIVESINWINIGSYYRRIMDLRYVTSYWCHETWIEGIGSNRGVMQSGHAGYVGGWTWFLCMKENDTLVYMNPDYTSCYIISTGMDESRAVRISLYPDPANDFLIIENPGNLNIGLMTIIGFDGRSVLELVPGGHCVDISGVHPGIYLVKVVCENDVFVRKIVIE
jgi:hypothetical protein